MREQSGSSPVSRQPRSDAAFGHLLVKAGYRTAKQGEKPRAHAKTYGPIEEDEPVVPCEGEDYLQFAWSSGSNTRRDRQFLVSRTRPRSSDLAGTT